MASVLVSFFKVNSSFETSIAQTRTNVNTFSCKIFVFLFFETTQSTPCPAVPFSHIPPAGYAGNTPTPRRPCFTAHYSSSIDTRRRNHAARIRAGEVPQPHAQPHGNAAHRPQGGGGMLSHRGIRKAATGGTAAAQERAPAYLYTGIAPQPRKRVKFARYRAALYLPSRIDKRAPRPQGAATGSGHREQQKESPGAYHPRRGSIVNHCFLLSSLKAGKEKAECKVSKTLCRVLLLYEYEALAFGCPGVLCGYIRRGLF